MKVAVRMALVMAVSIALAWGMSLLPEIQPRLADPVFGPDKSGRLTEANMVDALVALPLDLRIARADFRQSVMSVDLFLPKGVSGERFVYHDLYELSRFAWSTTTNVDRLLVRVMLEDGADRQMKELLLAMEAKRTQGEPAGQPPASGNVNGMRTYLEERYHFSYTPKWKEQS
jgi:hypothetical protein